MKIKVLEKITAEQIAAGEVIENPASVVKELVENALDAGATTVEVTLENGGKSLIAVTDNGHGIAASELPLAFKRFATSKLNALSDLDSLKSLGFRGEALPSIAAVARVNLFTRPKGALAGALIKLEGGTVSGEEEVGVPYGTRVEVRDLFFNTPGRLKFLRADSVESSKVSTMLSEMSLAHPATAFTLKSAKRNLFSSPGDGNLLHAIGSLYGSDTAEAMVEINRSDNESGCTLTGYTSVPHLTRSSRRWISLVVNGRLIKNPMMVNALERAYGELLPGKRHPLAVLNLSVPPEKIDVNVHPAKIEIRLQEPEAIKNLTYRAVKLALQVDHQLPGWPETKRDGLIEDSRDYQQQSAHNGSAWEKTRLFEQPAHFGNTENHVQSPDRNYPEFRTEMGTVSNTEAQAGSLHLIGQFLQSYLVVQNGEDLLLIDQHAAHERVNYHRLQQSEQPVRKKDSVQLTIPITLELPATWKEDIPRLLPLLKESGFDLEQLGEDTYAVRSVPFMLQQNSGSSQVYDLIEELINADYSSETDYRQAILKTIACHRSVTAKQALTRTEMEKLLEEWGKTPRAEYCPHGRPTVIRFDRAQLQKGFHRKGQTDE